MNERIRLLAEQAFFDENTNQPSDKMYTFSEHKMQQFADINMGIGIVIFGLGAVMIGESLQKLSGQNGIGFQLLMVLVGCLLFRLIMAFTLASGVDPNLMKLFNAAVVLVFVSLPVIRKKIRAR